MQFVHDLMNLRDAFSQNHIHVVSGSLDVLQMDQFQPRTKFLDRVYGILAARCKMTDVGCCSYRFGKAG